MNDTIPVAIDGEPKEVTLPDFFDQLNYVRYRSHRERLTNWSAERVQVMFVRVGMGNLHDVQRWEARYQEEVVAP